MKILRSSFMAFSVCIFSISAFAFETEDVIIRDNMQVIYKKPPGEVKSFLEMFTKSNYYGRLRSNTFLWDWRNTQPSKTENNREWGLGGSLVYKTGIFYGVSANLGLYGTLPVLKENTDSAYPGKNFAKSGKDTFRTEYDGGEDGIVVLAEATLDYKLSKTGLSVGRQKIDTMLLASNDTKMVPQTFEAISIQSKDIPDSTFKAGYLIRQKLRDHQTFHSLMAFAPLDENDDSGAHKGLSLNNIRAMGRDTKPGMIFVTAENKSIPNLKLNMEYYRVEDYFNSIIAEANYKVPLFYGWSITPGFRYFKQMDLGAGEIGGASITGTFGGAGRYTGAPKGYSNPNSVDGSVIAARVVLANGPFALTAGYAKTSDNADIIAQWRNFPTAGYTRLMGQIDWIANTETWAVKTSFDFGKAGLVPGLKTIAAYQMIDFDEAKVMAGSTTLTDRDVFTFDAIQSFKFIPNIMFKFRMGLINAENSYTNKIKQAKDYNSYNEYRFEVDYLF